MAYEDSKRLLAQAETFGQRSEAIRHALDEGMPLWEIEQFLDGLDQHRPPVPPDSEPSAQEPAE
jgi:hypothetical protein